MPAFRLATDDDMRAITSRDLAPILELPHLYIPADAVKIPLPPLTMATEGVELMRVWGVAHEHSIADFARLFPTALVARREQGPFIARADLLYHGAEPAADFVPSDQRS